MLKRFLKSQLALYVLGALVLSFGAFFNWFPFFTGDTSVYINSGFEHYVPGERPIFYGWFLRYTSLGFSLWLTAMIQSLLLAFVLIRLIKIYLPGLSAWWTLFVLLLMGLFTGVWWESTKLIPDVFVAIMALGLLCLLFEKQGQRSRLLVLAIIWLSASVHLSHAAVLLAFTAFVLLINPFNLRTKSLVIELSTVAVLTLLGLFLTNAVLEGNRTIAQSNEVFLLGKLNEAGLLDLYLEDNCDKQDLPLCAYKDSLPATAWQFVWDPNGAVMKLGGWEANERENQLIISGILFSPKYWPLIVYKGIMATGVQLSQMQVGDNLFRQEKGSNSIQSIEKYFPHEKNAALWTKQFLLELPFRQMSWYYALMTILSVVVLLYLKATKKLSAPSFHVFLMLALLLVLNAAVTANLANIASRLNQRLLWLLPALVIIELFRLYYKKASSA